MRVRPAGRDHSRVEFDATGKGKRDSMNTVHDSMARQGLVRPRDGRMLAGVCAGLARRFGLDPWVTRLLFVLTLFVIPGSQILIYPLLWLLMPAEESAYAATTYPPAA
jgi:phage shock protein PspC (stress-responsive transcriptional regulator)